MIACSVSNNIVRNVIIFDVDSGSSSHTDNHESTILVKGEKPTDDVNLSVGTAEKKLSMNFIKSKTKFCLSLHYNGDS